MALLAGRVRRDDLNRTGDGTMMAYGGPGSVITGIGAFLAVLAALVAAIFGFLWYPLKKLIRAMRGGPEQGDDEAARQQGELARE